MLGGGARTEFMMQGTIRPAAVPAAAAAAAPAAPAGALNSTGAAAAAAAAAPAAQPAVPLAAVAGPGGRGAGPDHREARPAEAMAAMVTALRPLPLAARTWDFAAYKARGMRPAPRPGGSGLVGREVPLLVNHLPVKVNAPEAVNEYVVTAERKPPGGGAGGDAGSVTPRLLWRLVSKLAEAQGWPAGWVVDGSAVRVYAAEPLRSAPAAAAAAEGEAPMESGAEEAAAAGDGDAAAAPKQVEGTVELLVGEEELDTWVGFYQVTLSLLGRVDLAPQQQEEPKQQQDHQQQTAAAAGSGATSPAPSTPAAGGAPRLSPAALRVVDCVIRTALLADGGGSPAAVAAALAAGPPPAAAAPADAAAPAAPAETDSAAAAAAPSQPAPPAATSSADGAFSSGSGAAAPAAAPPPPAPVLPTDTPCVVINGCVCVCAPARPDCAAPLGGGAEAWVGFRPRLSQTQGGLTLALDVETRALVRPGPLPALAEALFGPPAAAASSAAGADNSAGDAVAEREGDLRLLSAVAVGLEVAVALPGAAAGAAPARRVIRGLSSEPSALEAAAAGRAGRRAGLPAVDVGTGAEPEWVAAELCSVLPGQPYPCLDDAQSETLARFGARRPAERRALLEAFLANGARFSGSAAARAFGVEVAAALPAARGRVLPPPYLSYSTPECMYPGTQGHWSLHTLKPAAPKAITSWACVSLVPREEVDIPGPAGLPAFLSDLSATLAAAGVECTPPPIVFADPATSVLHHMRAGCEAAQQQYSQPCQLLLVLMHARSGPLYAEVKMASDAALGLPSQCLVAPTAGVGTGVTPRGRLQYCTSLLLSINAKLGGVNHRLAGDPAQVVPTVGVRPFVLIGAAIARPPPAAAARGGARRRRGRVLLQPAGAGEIQGMAGAVRELLVDFYRANGARKPEALIVYRAWEPPVTMGDAAGDTVTGDVTANDAAGGIEGGSEAEAARRAAVDAEYGAIRKACLDLEEEYCPPITFITVTRRHNTRFFPSDREASDKTGNPPPGTVVDSSVCSPSAFDFYLTSHAGGPGGHTRAAHYTVAVDESGFSGDGLQLLTYWLTYLFANCTRSVAVAPPAYYAELAAQRGLLLSTRGAGAGGVDELYTPTITTPPAPTAAAAAADGAGGEGAAAPQPPVEVRVHPKLGGTMHYL